MVLTGSPYAFTYGGKACALSEADVKAGASDRLVSWVELHG